MVNNQHIWEITSKFLGSFLEPSTGSNTLLSAHLGEAKDIVNGTFNDRAHTKIKRLKGRNMYICMVSVPTRNT